MKDIAGLNVRQIRIFDPDLVPFRFLRTKVGTDYVMNQFQFKETATQEGEIFFSAGSYVNGDGSLVIPINMLMVNDRRITVDVAGPTELGTLVYEEVSAIIASLDPPERRLAARGPLITAHETTCTVTMDFEWNDLLAGPLVEFLEGPAVAAMQQDQTFAKVSDMNLRFTISFVDASDKLSDIGITLSDKLFVIEPRSNTPLSERRFFTTSPLESPAHLELLSELEQAIVARRGKRRKSLPPVT